MGNLSPFSFALIAAALLGLASCDSATEPPESSKPKSDAAAATPGRKPAAKPRAMGRQANRPTKSAKMPDGSNRPNIVLISIDTLRADHLGTYGYERDTSPALDRFAKEAVQFDLAISQAPVTAPAHMSLFTGVMPTVHGVFNHRTDGQPSPTLAPSLSPLPEILGDHGYLTFGFHGGGNVSSSLGFDRGFKLYTNHIIEWAQVKSRKGTLLPMRKAIRNSISADRPLFLFLHNYLCHSPYLEAPEEDRFRYLKNPVKGLPTQRRHIIPPGKKAVSDAMFWRNIDLAKAEHREHVIGLYDGGIRHADFVFSRIEAVLRDEGIWDDSYVVVLSDHGEEFHEHEDRMHWRLFIETLHVPLLIKFPKGKHAGRRISQPVRTFDIMPTLLAAAAIEPPNDIQATSLAPLLEDGGIYDPVIVSHAKQEATNGALRYLDDAWIYSNQMSAGCDEWLFRSDNDPGEQSNLATTEAERLVAMRKTAAALKAADQWLSDKLQATEGDLAEPDAALMEQLEGLGYVK